MNRGPHRVDQRRFKARIAGVAALALAASGAAVSLAGPAAAATTFKVGNPATCTGATSPTIGAAVALAQSGDTIQVCAGTYTENVDDGGKALTFLGPEADVDPLAGTPRPGGEATVDGNAGTAFHFSGASTLNGFTVIGATTNVDTPGVFAVNGASLSNNIFTGNNAAAIITGDNFSASKNLVTAPSTGGYGFFFNSGGGSGSSVTDNAFAGNLSGSAINVADPDAAHRATGLQILRNTADTTAGGNFVVVGGTRSLEVADNTVVGGSASGTAILLLGDSAQFTIERNVVFGVKASAVSLSGGYGYPDNGDGTIFRNRLQNNVRGINVFSDTGTIEAHFNVLTGNTVDSGNANSPNAGIRNATDTSTVNAQDNFWGCNTGPGTAGCDAVLNTGPNGTGTVTFSPWLVLKSSIGTKTLTSGQTTTFKASLRNDSNGNPIVGGSSVLDGLPITFSATGQLTVNPTQSILTDGSATTTVKAKSIPAGTTATGGTVSGQVVNAKTTQTGITVNGPALPKPALAIHDVSTVEGRSGTHVLYFPVTLNHKYNKVITVKYATANGSAKAPSDYVAKSGTITFPVGATTERIGITINGDTVKEQNETFFVTIYSATNANISDPNASGVIRNS